MDWPIQEAADERRRHLLLGRSRVLGIENGRQIRYLDTSADHLTGQAGFQQLRPGVDAKTLAVTLDDPRLHDWRLGI